jgi:hypothetical protein
VMRVSADLSGWLVGNVPRSIPGARDCHGSCAMHMDVHSRNIKNKRLRMPVISPFRFAGIGIRSMAWYP